MSKALELLAKVSPTGTPIGVCDLCHVEGPLKHERRDGESLFVCIPCIIDGRLS